MTFHVVGMMGLGDNLHQRAVIRQLMPRGVVYLETPWPSAYWDLVGDRLHLIPIETRLRTQVKNQRREATKYTARRAPPGSQKLKVWYTHEQMRQGPILKGMLESVGLEYLTADFSLPIAPEWDAQVDQLTASWTQPFMVYRPLVERGEWGGCRARNPDFAAYAALAEAAGEGLDIVSLADINPPQEYIVGTPVAARRQFHHGELSFEVLAALFKRARVAFTSPGFATVLGQAVGTALIITVYGGHEDSRVCCAMNNTLCIDPIHPCCCLTHACGHDKTIDIPRAIARIKERL